MEANEISMSPLLKSLLYIIGGEVAIEIGIELMHSKNKDITDEDITEAIKERIQGTGVQLDPDNTEILKLNTVRKTLYKLYSEKLAQFRRIRDKSTGWFIYYWWEEFNLLEEILLDKRKIVQRKLRDRLEYEEKNYFFLCKKCGPPIVKYKFDEAFEMNFKCPNCSDPLVAEDNSKTILFLKERIVLSQNIQISNLVNS
jgi:transcription initiation factor TFIIE subunit alpha